MRLALMVVSSAAIVSTAVFMYGRKFKATVDGGGCCSRNADVPLTFFGQRQRCGKKEGRKQGREFQSV